MGYEKGLPIIQYHASAVESVPREIGKLCMLGSTEIGVLPPPRDRHAKAPVVFLQMRGLHRQAL